MMECRIYRPIVPDCTLRRRLQICIRINIGFSMTRESMEINTLQGIAVDYCSECEKEVYTVYIMFV